jgi:CxxC motif-containing protein
MKKVVCIICPNGCLLEIDKQDGEFIVMGNMCQRGREFGINEIINPKRSICSTVRTSYKSIPRLPVRTDGEIPFNLVFNTMKEINEINLDHPVHSGEIIIENILETGVNIIATSDMYYLLGEELYQERGKNN